MRIVILAILFVVCSPSFGDSYRFGSKVLSDGDPIGRVHELAGNPDRTVRLTDDYGVQVGERWEYYRDGKTISITISNGRVTRITELR